jgi:hypothetical protein
VKKCSFATTPPGMTYVSPSRCGTIAAAATMDEYARAIIARGGCPIRGLVNAGPFVILVLQSFSRNTPLATECTPGQKLSPLGTDTVDALAKMVWEMSAKTRI